MQVHDRQSGPPPLPGAAPAPEARQSAPVKPTASPVEKHSGPPAEATATRTPTHWPTVLFGALPATCLAFPAGVAILAGLSGGARGLAVSVTGICWWAAMISLWIAARSRPMISKPTAVGLVLGIVAAVHYVVLGVTKGHPPVDLKWPWLLLLVGPVWISLGYVHRLRELMRTDPAASLTLTPKPPPSEASTRRVGLTLKVLLFGQVFTGTVFGATLLSGSAGLGGLMIVVLAFPIALGVACFSVWSFIRHHSQRPWAIAVFFAPFALSMLLQNGVKLFGESAMTAACGHVAPWLPLGGVLLFPRTAGRLIPRPLRGRAACITYVALHGLMLLVGGLIALGLRMTLPGKAGDLPQGALFLALAVPVGVPFAGLSVAAGVTGLLVGYVGLFRPRGQRFLWLSLAHMMLSVPLLALGIWWLRLLAMFLGNPG